MIYVLGVDPGFRHTGLVLARITHEAPYLQLENLYCLHAPPDTRKQKVYKSDLDFQAVRRMTEQFHKYIDVLDSDGKYVQALAIELPHAGSKSARAGHALGMAKGWVAAYAYLQQIPVVLVTPYEVKLITGSGKASKLDIQQKVRSVWPVASWPEQAADLEHVADAAAALLVALNSDPFMMLRAQALSEKDGE